MIKQPTRAIWTQARLSGFPTTLVAVVVVAAGPTTEQQHIKYEESTKLNTADNNEIIKLSNMHSFCT